MDTPAPTPFTPFNESQIERRLAAAPEAFPAWRILPFAERAAHLNRAADLMEERADQLGKLITTEMGKPLASAVQEVHKCVKGCRFYSEYAEAFLAPESLPGPAARIFIRYVPLGPVLAVMPWNFPFWQVFRFAAPTLMAGNVALLKHASNVAGCAIEIEKIFTDAGFPLGVFQTLLIGAAQVKAVIHDERVRAVTLTGSVTAGRQVAAEAGASLKKVVLELGGSDPFIILPSADLDRAISTAVQARTVNSGQSCIAAKRFIIAESIYDEVERRMVEAIQALRVGDPFSPETQIGPLATAAIVEEVNEQVLSSVAGGARLLTGGHRLNGTLYEPTVLADIPRESRAYREELFGPVALLFRARDVAHALALANDTEFGLGAAAWTRDPEEEALLIAGLDAGQVFINGMVASDPRLPFGGTKNSGYGRELGAAGIREFVNLKTVCTE